MTTLRVSNTNSSGKNETAVRVYNNNILVGEVFPKTRNPLAYIVRHNGQYRKSLIQQCAEGGVSEADLFKAIGIHV